MTKQDDRLRGCFAVAFPELGPEQIGSASVNTVAEWDSLRAVVLVALIEEAFTIRIPARDYPQLRSYAAVDAYLHRIAGDEE